ncbi:MAG TPA: excinuclease ABC subunit UvrB [Candidatus Eisenbacteria bacterium]|nr:excinuclease ABC subunit UvrB [Candidatus Eisenbacteria bacterium]
MRASSRYTPIPMSQFQKADFRLRSRYEPAGDQGPAIRELTEGVLRGDQYQCLLGVTGSGKTFTMANVIARLGLPTLVISHNKTLAAQLYGEFRQFFPENAVGYFVSYYDYYQPEAYLPSTDTYIEKDASINEDLDRLRLAATANLLSRRDVIIVASVSCIYGLGSPETFQEGMLAITVGQALRRDDLLHELVNIHYQRNDVAFSRGHFRVRGDVIEVRLAYEETAVRIELFDDQIEQISVVNHLTGNVLHRLNQTVIYPAKHFLTPEALRESVIREIRHELADRLEVLNRERKFLEAQRLKTRTEYDLEMLREMGYCAGIENYSRFLSGRKPGERPYCLLDYFPKDWLLIIDESHVTVPQIGGMYEGDRSRKETLVEHGFRLPSALDNRPLRYAEFETLMPNTIFVSATPADYELNKTQGVVVEQIIRPTGLVDPQLEVRPSKGQIDDLLAEIRKCTALRQRVLITTLTKRMAEDLTEYLVEVGVGVRYLHSDIDAIERMDILRGLRLHEFDVVVGVNLLREGLDLPEVSLVIILDADKEGFLRSERSLIQTAGRSARHLDGRVILYADRMTGSMQRAIEETRRRREKQMAYNAAHGIVPRGIEKSMEDIMLTTAVADVRGKEEDAGEELARALAGAETEDMIQALTREMKKAAAALEFERAASLRDKIRELVAQAQPETLSKR